MEFNNSGFNAIIGMGEGSLGARMPVFLCNRNVTCEISEDFTLPEYLPEIRRVLKVGAIVSQPSKYLAPASLKLSGNVEYNLLYVGSDGRIYCGALSDEYEFNVPFEDGTSFDPDGSLLTLADTFADEVICKVMGARKLNIKSRICATAKVTSELWVSGGAGLPSDNHMQKLIKSSECMREIFGENSEMEAVDELDLSMGERYVCSDCRIFVEGATAHEGYAECRGTVIMRHIIEREGGGIYEISRKIPFSESVEVNGMSSGIPLVASGRCNGIIKASNEDEEGDGTPAVTVSAHIRLWVKGYQKQSLRYVKDAYSTRYESENETERFSMPLLYTAANRNMTINETRGVEEITSGAELIGADSPIAIAEANVEGVELSESGRYAINGKCRFHIVFARGESETVEYSSADVEIPFRYECSESGEMPSTHDILAEAVNPRVRIDGERVDLGCELVIAYAFGGREEIEYVKLTKMGAEIENKKKGYVVCYPDEKDSLWSVSKKYRASVDVTARGNGIDASSSIDLPCLAESVRYMIV